MRFEKTETVEGISPNAVLSSLETHLSALALEVVRTGARLTAYGIGPSPRIVNPNDTTVVEAKVENGSSLKTMLRIDVSYQASALLGDATQDDVVWRKIDGALQEMRGDLRMRPLFTESQRRSAAAAKATDSGMRRAAEAEVRAQEALPMQAAPPVAVIPVAAPDAAETMGVVVVEEPVRVVESPVAAEEIGEAAEATPVSEVSEEPAVSEVAKAPAVEEPVSKKVEQPLAEPKPAEEQARPQPVFWSTMLRDAEDVAAEEEPRPRRRVWPIVAAVLLLCASGASAYAWLHQDWAAEQWKVAQEYLEGAEQRFGIGGEPAQVTKPVEAAPVDAAAPEPAAVAALDAAKSAAKAAKVEEPDVRQWIANWGEAMQTGDAAAQAAFYADTVDRYLQRNRVSNDEVRQDKELAIEDRVGQFSVKVEDVVVEAQTSTQAWVRLVKDYVVTQAGSAAMERRVRSTLHLRKVNGVWKIVEERDL